MRSLVEGHPWKLTLKEFLERACSEYGHKLHETAVFDPSDKRVAVPYVECPDGKKVPLPSLAMEDVLDEFVTGNLCRRLRIPPEDFGLYPDEPYDGSEWDA